MIKNTFIIISLGLFLGVAHSQGHLVANNSIIIENGISLVVEGDILLETNQSFLKNRGAIIFKNNWINNTDSIGLFNNEKGTVFLDGENQQIKGTHSTLFKNLVLNNQGELKSFEIDTSIDSLLEINGAILETNGNFVHLKNPKLEALTWNSNGIISTNTLGGQFLRNTNATTPYPFPLGNQNLDHNYRVVEITPSSAQNATYGASLLAQSVDNVSGVSINGTNAPFFSEDKEDRIESINTNYFHTIYQHQGTGNCKVSIYFYSDDSESLFTSVAQWKTPTINQWKNKDFEIATTLSPMSNYGMPNRVAQKSIIEDFESDVFAFVETELFIPNGFTPNNDGINDNFEIKNIEQYPNNEIVILNRWGNEIYKANPYQNDWNGNTNVEGIYLQGKELMDGTYFYILKLNETLPVLKGYVEIKGE